MRPEICFDGLGAIWFQFQNGTIMSENGQEYTGFEVIFQFQNGTIMSVSLWYGGNL